MFIGYNLEMNKVRITFILGVWIAILPQLGFPYSLKNILFLVSGLAIIYVSYLTYRELKAQEPETKTFENFSENQ